MRLRAALAVVSFVLCAGPATRADDAPKPGAPPAADTAPDHFVPNPRYAAWASFEPGAWVHFEVVLGEGAKAKDMGHRTEVMEEKSPDVAGVLEVPPADAQGQEAESIVAYDEPSEVPASVLPILRGGMTDADLEPRIEESKAELALDQRKLACTLRVARIGEPGADGSVEIRTWWSPEVPGGLALSERREVQGGDHTLVRQRADRWGTKPQGGGFAWPLRKDSRREWIDNPEFARWAAFTVGSWAQYTTKVEGGGQPSQFVRTLLDVRSARVLVEAKELSASEAPTVVGRRAGQRETDEPRWIERRYRRNSPAARDRDHESQGFKVVKRKSRASLTVAGQALDCEVTEERITKGDDTFTTKEWANAGVPGAEVRWEFRMETGGKLVSAHSSALEAFGTSAPSK